MALTEITIDFDLRQLLGADFDTRRTKGYVTTNVESNTLMDTSTGETRLGDQTVTINADGTGSFTTWAVGTDGNPTSWQTTLVVDYPRTGQRDRKTRRFGPYTLAAADDGKNITDLEEQQAIPAEFQTSFTASMQSIADDAQGSADDAAASASAANSSASAAAASAAEAAEIIVTDLGTTDAQTAFLIENPSDTQTALTASIATIGDARFALGNGAVQPFMRKLVRGESCKLAILSDSTDDASNEWGRLLGNALAAAYPTMTVTWTPPADDAYTPGTTITIQTGTAGTLAISNMAIAGSQSYNWQSADFLTQLTTVNPDLILLASGHNDGGFTGDPQNLGQPRMAFRLRYQLLLEELRRLLPYAQRVIIAQHPWSDHPNGDMDQKRDELRLLAERGGDGFVDMYQEWTDVGSATTSGWYNVGDNVHINATGEQFYADTIGGIFVYDPKWEPRPARASLLELATPLNLADDMVMPSGATSPVGWTLDNVTVTRETTAGYFEAGRGYSIKVVPVDPAQKSRIYKQILSSTTVLPWRGKWVTVLVRMRRNAAGGVDNRYVGQISTSDGVFTGKTFNDDKGYGGFMWRAIPHYVDTAATSLTVSLWCDNGPTSGGTHDPTVWWDRFMVVPGLTPYGWAGRSGVTSLRNGEKFESVTVGDSTMAQTPSLSMDAIAGVARDLAVKTAGTNRWIFRISSESETGSNAGSNYQILARDDAGAAVGTALTLNRRRLNAVFGAWGRFASYVTGSLPSTSLLTEGDQMWDSTVHKPKWYDGANIVEGKLTKTGTVASSATPTIATGNSDVYFTITALATAITSMTTNLTGSPSDGQRLWIAITDNGTPRSITWGSQFEASTVALPTTTVASTRLDVEFIYNGATSKWRCIRAV